MQIDFHHAVTYVVARLAGFPHTEADTIAWSAQFVDDAVDEGIIAFMSGEMYYHIASAHKMLDYRNLDKLSNHRAWIPFHFLPGNEGLPAGEGTNIEFARRIICRPDSYAARDMLDLCIARKGQTPYHLHQLGIAMHVYADTWAHQGFSGISHKYNKVYDLRDEEQQSYGKMIRHINDYYSRWSKIKNRLLELVGVDVEKSATEIINNFLPLGHGAALSMPDKPYLVWRYKDGMGREVVRDNPREFLAAADAMCRQLQRYRGEAAQGLAEQDKRRIDELLRGITDSDSHQRHLAWLGEIQHGAFSFGKESKLFYIGEGGGSWKSLALGESPERHDDDERYRYDPRFMQSHWKLFHDALLAHRHLILNDLLPRYGICAA